MPRCAAHEIARAFTGWRLEDDGTAYLKTNQHDYESEFPQRGPKAIFDNAHGFGPGGASFTTQGEGENEIDVVIDILFDHEDSDGQKRELDLRTRRRGPWQGS